tara:strand:- start:673 stop:1284 length:612 start_codon:yes stop_codon:yes gene_type:complete
MAKYAKGKKSYAMSDRGGQRLRYTQLKTTWDGLRVAPDEWEPKHPQLTPAKNIIDAEQLFKPRGNNDPDNVVIQLAYTWDIFAKYRTAIGTVAYGSAGSVSINMESVPSPAGLAGTGATGDELIELSIDEAGVAGTGAVGVEALSLSIDEAGVAGTGAVGAEALILSIAEAGVAGTGAVGNESISISEAGWSGGDWGEGTWGN